MTALAGGNAGAQAWLSWSSSGIQSDLTNPGSYHYLYIRVEGAASFKGAEFDLTWNPPGDGESCEFLAAGPGFGTSTNCTYLNRGNAASIVPINEAGHLRVAWANDEADTSCTAGGTIVNLLFEFDGCEDPTGCFRLNALKLVDADGVQDTADVEGATATVQEGSSYCGDLYQGGNSIAPPVVAPIADRTIAAGTALTVTPSATDPNGLPLLWSGTNLPAGATVDSTSGQFAWSTGSDDHGKFPGVSLIAADSTGATGASAFDVTVQNPAHAPVVDAMGNKTEEAARFIWIVPSASDPDGDTLRWSGTNLPSAGASIDSLSGAFSWFPDPSAVGTYESIALTATEGVCHT